MRRMIAAGVVIGMTGAASVMPGSAKGADVQRFTVAGRSSATPSIVASGNRVVVVWTASVDAVTDLFAAISEDGGVTFSEPRRVNDRDDDVDVYGEQPPRAAIARDIWVVWTSKKSGATALRVTRSSDGGRTFAPATSPHPDALAGSRGWQSVAAGSDGSVHALWLDGRPSSAARAAASATEGAPAVEHAPHAHHGESRGLYYARLDVPAQPRSIEIAKEACQCCKTALAGGPNGTLHAAWRHIFPGSLRDIGHAAWSSRKVPRVSTPTRISHDNWRLDACPDDGPAIAVDRRGTTHVAWPTFVDGPTPAIGIFHSSSTDGRHFARRVRVDVDGVTDPSHPQIALDDRGQPVVVWDELAGSQRRVVLRRGTAASGRFTFGAVEVLSAADAALYPVAAAVPGALLIAWTDGVGPSAAIALRRLAVR